MYEGFIIESGKTRAGYARRNARGEAGSGADFGPRETGFEEAGTLPCARLRTRKIAE